jgi:hypothetical protein
MAGGSAIGTVTAVADTGRPLKPARDSPPANPFDVLLVFA